MLTVLASGLLTVGQADRIALERQEWPLMDRFALETGLGKRSVVIGKFSHVRPRDSVVRDGETPSATFDEILEGKAGEREHDEQRERDRVELPPLFEAGTPARFQQDTES